MYNFRGGNFKLRKKTTSSFHGAVFCVCFRFSECAENGNFCALKNNLLNAMAPDVRKKTKSQLNRIYEVISQKYENNFRHFFLFLWCLLSQPLHYAAYAEKSALHFIRNIYFEHLFLVF